jgi:hypothetical protein
VSPSLHATSIHAHSCLQALDYGVREGNILGIKHGFKGFLAKPHRLVVLTRQARSTAGAGSNDNAAPCWLNLHPCCVCCGPPVCVAHACCRLPRVRRTGCTADC